MRVVYDVGAMWQAATEMCHKQLDPLDPEFLNYLQLKGTYAK